MGGGVLIQKGEGCSSVILKIEKNLNGYQDPIWACLEIVFTHQEEPILKQHFCHICSAQYRKRYCKSSGCGPFEAEYPKRHHNRLINP